MHVLGLDSLYDVVTVGDFLAKGVPSVHLGSIVKETGVDLLHTRLVLVGLSVLLEMGRSPWTCIIGCSRSQALGDRFIIGAEGHSCYADVRGDEVGPLVRVGHL